MFNRNKPKIEITKDKEGNAVIKFTAEPGAPGGPGSPGKPGIGIKDIDCVDNVIKITLDDGTEKEFEIKLPKIPESKPGKAGTGIQEILLKKDNILCIILTNGIEYELPLQIRQPDDGKTPVIDYNLIKKQVLNEIEIPQPGKPPTALEVALALKENELVKDGKSVDKELLKEEILKGIEIPKAEKIDLEVLKKEIIAGIEVPEAKNPPTALEVAQALKDNELIKDGRDGEDHPLAEVLNYSGIKKSIIGGKDQLILEKELPDGFNVVIIHTTGKIADRSGAFASGTRYFIDCTNGVLSKIDEKPIFIATGTTSVLKSTVKLESNKVQIFCNGVEYSETTWKVDIEVQ